MKRLSGLLFVGIGLLAAQAALAAWQGKGEAGVVIARGNSETETINAKLEMSRTAGKWKHTLAMDMLRATNTGSTTANRYGARWQTDYNLNERSFWFGGLRYEKDRFSGFDYQESASAGYGYKFIDSKLTKFKGQIGGGYRRSRDSLAPFSTADEIILRGNLDFERQLGDSTKLLDAFLVESGSSNTYASNDLSLQVKMSDKLALAVGLTVRRNSSPPAPLKQTDTVSTVSLVYAF